MFVCHFSHLITKPVLATVVIKLFTILDTRKINARVIVVTPMPAPVQVLAHWIVAFTCLYLAILKLFADELLSWKQFLVICMIPLSDTTAEERNMSVP